MHFANGVSAIRSAVRPDKAHSGRRGALAAVAAVAMTALGAWPAAASAVVPGQRTAAVTVEFGYVGPHVQHVTVPAGVHAAEVRVIGGHGGSTGGTAEFVTGGDGAQITGRLPVFPGQVLSLYVAGHGHNNDRGVPGAGGWGATGYGGRGGDGSGLFGYGGAGGGGASAITDSTNADFHAASSALS
jgi:hypothetical protein